MKDQSKEPPREKVKNQRKKIKHVISLHGKKMHNF
jgi:hypothetical protein